MRGVVIEKGEKYVTFLNGLFASINGIQKNIIG